MGSGSPPPLSPRSRSNTSNTSIALETKTFSYTPRCTTDQYIKAIAHHSQRSRGETLYAGEIYETLKRFLEQEPSRTGSSSTRDGCTDFAWLISPSQPSQPSQSDKSLTPDNNKSRGRFEGFSDPESCIEALKSNIEISYPQVLFLRGHPSPDWIASIGAFCNADPELFRWFLRYRAGQESDAFFDSPPSMMSAIYRFKFFTVGSRNHRNRSSQDEVDELRTKTANELQRYQAELRAHWALKPGDSIVRNFYVLDERHCVIEQDIVISIFDIGKTWLAIACTDAGNDLTNGPRLPWIGGVTEQLPITLLPIVQYRPRCALKSRGIYESIAAPKRGKNTQTLAVFPEGYGHGLDWSLARSDRFYVLSDMLRLAAFSQKQLLNVIKDKIEAETKRLSLDEEKPTLANLLYFREILQDQLCDTSSMIKLTDPKPKPSQTARRPTITSTADQRLVAEQAMAEVHSLFEELRAQAEFLQEKCTQGMTVISHKSMLAESHRAIKQAGLVTKLTLVAFFYLPFTFTAGFFGMNFKELGTGTNCLWIFFAASIPLMGVTMAFLMLDAQTVKRFWQRRLKYRDPH